MIMKLIYALLSFSKRYPVKEASKKLQEKFYEF